MNESRTRSPLHGDQALQRWQRIGLGIRLACMAVALAACTTPLMLPPPPLPQMPAFDRPIVLLGEVHDHPQQHALRLEAFRAHLASGARPALVMEQLDRQHQPAIDAAVASGANAAGVIAAGQGGKGWNWAFYEPFVALALANGLPIVAANVGRDEARRVMRDGLQANGFDERIPAALADVLSRDIMDSHCGVLDEPTARRMVLAQVARDQQMARAVTLHGTRGAVLLAGNGHVRTDVGAPRWLDAATRARSVAIGVLEAGDTTTAFDRRVMTPKQPRPDPCLAFQRTASAPVARP